MKELSRKECFEYIKNHPQLQNKIKDLTGLHYINMTTKGLNVIISEESSFINRIKHFFNR